MRHSSVNAGVRKLRLAKDDYWFAGVCGGLAKIFGVESWLIRMGWFVLITFYGVGLLPYLLLWMFVPEE